MIKSVSPEKLTGTTLGNYRLQTFIGQSKLGPTYLARTDATNTYLFRFIEGPTYGNVKDYEAYLEHFQYRAAQIATLQHPYLLPLLDYGIYRGYPYLVSPHIPLRSLRTRISKNGSLNTFTVGRYLDQIATALEYSHEHAVLHGSLSVDSIFIRLDGQLVVADIGVRSLLELHTQDTPRNQLIQLYDGYAPEQLLGKPTSPATDVYTMGVVIYHLLTGAPVFEGSSPEEIAQQHLYTSIPPLSQWRSDLPAGLYSVLARAMAKDPSQRYHQPGAFANAYHSTTAPVNRTRLPFAVTEAPGAQPHQSFSQGATMADAPFSERSWGNNRTSQDYAQGLPRSSIQSAIPHSMHGFTDENSIHAIQSPPFAFLRRFENKRRPRLLLIAALVALLVIASSAIGINALLAQKSAAGSGSGQVTFFANQTTTGGVTNSLSISFQHLQAPAAGEHYEAWIINDQTEQVLDLGGLVENNQTWSLKFSTTSGNLLETGDKLEITQEQGAITAPAGKVILSGSFPVLAFQHIQHLLVSYPDTPGKVGMLIGLLQQTHELDIQASVLLSVSASHNAATIACVAQSMIDIIEGAQGAHYHPLSADCKQQNVTVTGDGFGLLGKGYVAGAEEHAALALSQKDATSVMHQHAALMDTALANVNGWVTTIEQDALQLLAHPTNLSSVQEVTTLADDAYHGVDANGDGQIDPVVGEAGAMTAYQQGQLMATLYLTPAA